MPFSTCVVSILTAENMRQSLTKEWNHMADGKKETEFLNLIFLIYCYGAIQVVSSTVGVGVSDFWEKSVTKV